MKKLNRNGLPVLDDDNFGFTVEEKKTTKKKFGGITKTGRKRLVIGNSLDKKPVNKRGVSEETKLAKRVTAFRKSIKTENEILIIRKTEKKKMYTIDRNDPQLINVGHRIMSIIIQRLTVNLREDYPIVFNKELKGWYIKQSDGGSIEEYLNEESIKTIIEEDLDFHDVIKNLFSNSFKFAIFKSKLQKEITEKNKKGVEIKEGKIVFNESIQTSRLFESARKKFGKKEV